MKTLKVLLEERAALESDIEGLTNKETLTADEETRLNEMVSNYEEKQNEVKAAEKRENVLKTIASSKNKPASKDNEGELSKRFSIVRAIEKLSNDKALDGAEAEMVAEGRKEFSNIGQSTRGGLVIPSWGLEARANVNENGTAGVDVLGFAEALQANSIARELGVSFFNLTADGKFVIQSPTTVTWEGEVDANADGGQALTTSSIVPKRLATKVLLSKQLLNQHNISVENAFVQDIARAVAAKLDYSLFNDDGFTEHAGNGVTPKSNASVSSLMGALVEQLMMSNVNLTNAKFAASAGLFAEIAAATQVSAVTPLLSGNRAYGYEVMFSSQIADNASAQEQIYFADWSSFIIGQWGGLDIIVDPYTVADNGQVKLVLNSFFDGNQKRTTDFALGAFTGTDIS
jgi:HK97 family phage major capsid protein